MTIINDVNMPNFTHKEIPPDKAKYMDRLILLNTQRYRNILGCPFSISLNDNALVRFDGRKTSEHYVIIPVMQSWAPVKFSRAIDGFPDCDIFEAWTKALSSKLFSGVGVYFDTKNNHGEPQSMLHLDLRPTPLIWYRYEGVYFYPHKDKDFFKNLKLLMNNGIVHSVRRLCMYNGNCELEENGLCKNELIDCGKFEPR